MQLASFRPKHAARATVGVLLGNRLLDLAAHTKGALPDTMLAFLERGDAAMEAARAVVREIQSKSAPGGDGKGPPNTYALEEVEVHAPVPRPGKIIHTACNFTEHLAELKTWKAEWATHNWEQFHYEHPTGFLEAPSSVVGNNAVVERPVFTKQLDYEIEIGIVIGKRAKNVKVEDALSYVAGYTVFNDLSARDIQAREHSNKVVMLGKSFDGSCPFGPFLVTRDEIADPSALDMVLKVNGEVRQKSSTARMRFAPAQLVSFWSLTTLEPGDIITGGSPPGVAAGMDVPIWLKPGDRIEAFVDRLGTLVTHIAEAS